MDTTRELYLVRHGETDFNRKRIVQGRGVNASLNERGREQSRMFFAAYGHLPFEHVFVSSLDRSQQTAEPFLERGLPWSAHPELDEIDWGRSEGKRANPAMKQEYRRIMAQWAQGEHHISLPGGESPLDVSRRMEQFMAHWQGQNHRLSLVISHGRAMRVLLCLLLERPLEDMEHFEHGNLGLYRLRYQDGRFELLLRKCDRHHQT